MLLVLSCTDMSIVPNGESSDTDADSDTDMDTATDTDTDTDTDTETDTELSDLTWVPISGGTFMQGSDSGDADEQPVHQVTVADFEVLKTEVTVFQISQCVAGSGCNEPSNDYPANYGELDRQDHPVNVVYFDEAVTFCAWAGGRLPTESEWEYAARSQGQNIFYPWGNATATCDYAIMMNEISAGCGEGITWPVCSNPAGNTDQGLCDMSGNVNEFVVDNWHDTYDGAPDNGTAWTKDGDPDRIPIRGGGFYHSAEDLRTTRRHPYLKNAASDSIGFRCVR